LQAVGFALDCLQVMKTSRSSSGFLLHQDRSVVNISLSQFISKKKSKILPDGSSG
jgi:hypothetical protein